MISPGRFDFIWITPHEPTDDPPMFLGAAVAELCLRRGATAEMAEVSFPEVLGHAL